MILKIYKIYIVYMYNSFHLLSFWLANSLCNVFFWLYLAYQPLLACGMEGVTYLFIFPCGVFPCLSLYWHGTSHPLLTRAAGLFLVLCLVLSCVSCTHMLCGSCTGGVCRFSCGMNVIVTNFALTYLFWLLDIWFIDDKYLVETFTYYLFTIRPF